MKKQNPDDETNIKVLEILFKYKLADNGTAESNTKEIMDLIKEGKSQQKKEFIEMIDKLPKIKFGIIRKMMEEHDMEDGSDNLMIVQVEDINNLLKQLEYKDGK